MALSLKEVEHIADLTRLELSCEEKQLFCEQLSAVLDHVARLQTLDTSSIPPTSSVLQLQCTIREDDPRPGLGLPELLRNAPQAEAGQFRVPPVLE
jgi:aspartyl-tRNA(Asn)/glutamyl-tRNA(Gln) amidotransferase subunit C